MNHAPDADTATQIDKEQGRRRFRVLVCGDRRLARHERAVVRAELERLETIHGPLVVVEGGASGADEVAGEWAEEQPWRTRTTFRADWSLGRQAGPLRNQTMVNHGADLVLAFPGPASRGTWDLVRRAKRAGIPVQVHPVGEGRPTGEGGGPRAVEERR
jgi:hypothetical protein